MVHLSKAISGNKFNRESKQKRISAVTAGIVNKILDTQLPDTMKVCIIQYIHR